jgi:spore maturation protein CgeB
MARIKKELLSKSEVFLEMQNKAVEHHDFNDCAVKAVAILSETPYEEVHAFMKECGRRNGRGTPWDCIWSAFRKFGCEFERVLTSTFIERYPGAHKNLGSITTHHPDRFKKVWADGNSYLFSCHKHVAAVVDGKNHDWTQGRAKRVIAVYKITKKGN